MHPTAGQPALRLGHWVNRQAGHPKRVHHRLVVKPQHKITDQPQSRCQSESSSPSSKYLILRNHFYPARVLFPNYWSTIFVGFTVGFGRFWKGLEVISEH